MLLCVLHQYGAQGWPPGWISPKKVLQDRNSAKESIDTHQEHEGGPGPQELGIMDALCFLFRNVLCCMNLSYMSGKAYIPRLIGGSSFQVSFVI